MVEVITKDEEIERAVQTIKTVIENKYRGEVSMYRQGDSIILTLKVKFILESSATSLLLKPISIAETVSVKSEGENILIALLFNSK